MAETKVSDDTRSGCVEASSTMMSPAIDTPTTCAACTSAASSTANEVVGHRRHRVGVASVARQARVAWIEPQRAEAGSAQAHR